jgi:hypothetical protein
MGNLVSISQVIFAFKKGLSITLSTTGYISNNGELFSPQKTVKSAAPLARSKANPTIVMQLYQDYQNYQKQAGKMLILKSLNLILQSKTFWISHIIGGFV